MKGKLRTAGWSIVFLALSFLSLSWGTVEITPREALVYTWQAVLGVESGSISSDVVQYLRLPHFVLAFCCGMGTCSLRDRHAGCHEEPFGRSLSAGHILRGWAWCGHCHGAGRRCLLGGTWCKYVRLLGGCGNFFSYPFCCFCGGKRGQPDTASCGLCHECSLLRGT